MSFKSILSALGEEESILALARPSIQDVCVPENAHALAIASYFHLAKLETLFVVTPTIEEASNLHADLVSILDDIRVELFPAWEILPFERVSPTLNTMGQRIKIAWGLRNSKGPKVVVSPIRATTQIIAPKNEIKPIVVSRNDAIDLQKTLERLIQMGFRRVAQVENKGEVANRGSILDVYPTTAEAPIRIDLWGDVVERLAQFSVSDQLTIAEKEQVQIFPARELLPTKSVKDRAMGLISSAPWGRAHWEKIADGEIFDGMESWLPWVVDKEETILECLPQSSRLIFIDPERSKRKAEELSFDESRIVSVLSQTWNIENEALTKRLHVPFDKIFQQAPVPAKSIKSFSEEEGQPVLRAKRWQLTGPRSSFGDEIQRLLDKDYSIYAIANSSKTRKALGKLFEREGVETEILETLDDSESSQIVCVIDGPICQGVIFPSTRIAVICEEDLTGRKRLGGTRRGNASGHKVFHEDLVVGSYVVHDHHGVAIYKGNVTQSIGAIERDYFLLEYRKGDRLYVPAEQINLLRPYTGGSHPRLSRMGGSDWQKTKTRVRSEIQEIVEDLVSLYQKRLATEGHAYPPDTPWQREIEDSFPFQETPDQIIAIQEVKEDMERRQPMDRLVCGDVGFGKTEIALRAAFKAIQDNKQVALLVPTTLLAQQHFQTFSTRLSAYPIRIEVLSRFLTTKEKSRVVNQLSTGEVDLVIGTHRLLSDDVVFHDLGLLVVDEEQRFGVKHKEMLKELKASIDVLTLSATPIPRTLEMSLTGIRDLTTLNTPPVDRQPILTFVGDYEESIVIAAIRRELLREGQVFFVHNRVADIEKMAETLRNLVPEARIAVAHGQMDENKLEKVVMDFWEGSFDVLVCTTIIESGIDMPSVNTLIVSNADRLGLGQLHQLRGRVGRSESRAYAYLLTPKGSSLSDTAYERLRTVGEATELGSGFRIAMRDLEIRGSGNLLGTGQSGHVASVGYDLYCQLVNEEVSALKGEPIHSFQEISIELPVAAQIPRSYISQEDLRLEAYRRLAICKSLEDVSEIHNEWIDRFGSIPSAAKNLLSVAKLRCEARKLGILEIAGRNLAKTGESKWVAKISPISLRPSEIVRVKRLYPGSVVKDSLEELQIVLNHSETPIEDLVDYLQQLNSSLEGEARNKQLN
ncbi:MAG: transcription-repair coupling factor [Acidimicrobiaceae bacterium]|nr:transcription-repair coupling factor [Acidimicrobiaceae bacterium]